MKSSKRSPNTQDRRSRRTQTRRNKMIGQKVRRDGTRLRSTSRKREKPLTSAFAKKTLKRRVEGSVMVEHVGKRHRGKLLCQRKRSVSKLSFLMSAGRSEERRVGKE